MQLLQNRSFAKPPDEQRAAGWLWLIKKAMDGMRTASKDFGDLVADAMKEIQFERGKADPQIYKDTNPKQQSCSTLTTQSWQQHHINRQLKCGIASENTCFSEST